MKKRRFMTKAIVCLIAFTLLLGGVIYLAARPISYNLDYYGEREDEYGFFAGHRYYTRNNYLIIKNTNYDLPLISFYYYKDGYAFNLRSETKEQYAQETEKINSRWEEALKVDFYSDKIDAYKLITVRPDGAETVYVCRGAVILTCVVAVAALVLGGLSCAYFVRYKKEKREAGEINKPLAPPDADTEAADAPSESQNL